MIENPKQKILQKIWGWLYPIFPHIEHSFLFFHNKKRQKYHVGWLAPHCTLVDLKKHLSSEWGFGNHFVAWEDSSQVLSWRKLTSFEEQYHIRVYSDGEIRGHYEYTPEAAPIRHFLEIGEQAKTRDFLKFLGYCVTTKKYVSHVLPDTTVASVDSEIIFTVE
jgi:hypothetical protein